MHRIFFAGCVLLVLAGCATLQDQSKNQLRDRTLEEYGAALRWGDFQGALDYVDPAVRAAHPLTQQQMALYDTVRVAEYEASDPVPTGPDTFEQTAQIELIVKSSQSAYGVLAHETWHWDAQAKHWWLESGLPDITPRRTSE
jgi:hypothetical protein